MKNFAIIFICVNLFCVSIISAQELVSVGLQKQLLVDDFVISEKQNITRELGKPQKKGCSHDPQCANRFSSHKAIY